MKKSGWAKFLNYAAASYLCSGHGTSSYCIVNLCTEDECNNTFLPFGKLLQQPHSID